jgi:hypothetical protein
VIEIHLDGKPVTKLQAARALAARSGLAVYIGIPVGEGRVIAVPDVSVYSTVRGEYKQLAEWPSGQAESAAGMRVYAGMFTLAAEVAELAEMIAAEQDAAGTAPASLVGRLVEDAFDDSPCPMTGLVVSEVGEDQVEVLWGDRQYAENPGAGSVEPIDALRPAREQARD